MGGGMEEGEKPQTLGLRFASGHATSITVSPSLGFPMWKASVWLVPRMKESHAGGRESSVPPCWPPAPLGHSWGSGA